MADGSSLIPKHGGYRALKSFQVAQLIYDLTVRFCDRYVGRRSRTHDQMVQAARSGVQNIAEGSQVSGTSKKLELKLTNVARASLEELRLDYQDFLRQRGLPQWPPDHPALQRFKARRCTTLDEVRSWVREERQQWRRTEGLRDCSPDWHGPARTDTDAATSDLCRSVSGPCQSVSRPCRSTPRDPSPAVPPAYPTLAANAALSLLNVACHLLDRQLAAQAAAFEREGGFTERLYRARSAQRGPRRPIS